MKKVLFLSVVFCGLATASFAQTAGTATPQPVAKQGAPDMAAMLQQAKEKQVPVMVEKIGITKEQATKIVEINFATRVAASQLSKDLSEADRSAKIAELKATKEKSYAEVLSADQVKALHAYYEEMQKNAPKRATN